MKATLEQVSEFRTGVFQHWKGPHYRALFLGQNSTNGAGEEPVVIYLSLDPGPHQGDICVRELWQWAEYVPGLRPGSLVQRFHWVCK